jgi:hypothetical protein
VIQAESTAPPNTKTTTSVGGAAEIRRADETDIAQVLI